MDTTNGEVLAYYAAHGGMTDPGEHAALLEGMPDDLATLCEVVRGLHMHYREGAFYGITIPVERLRTDEARTVREMLGRIRALDDRPLTVARAPENRLVGCCRDFALLLCALLRHQRRAARVRFGFGLYLNEDSMNDHVVCEYWNPDKGRWALADAQQDDAHVAMNGIMFDPLDIPHDRFVLAGDVWQQCRAGRTDSRRFGYDPELRGMWVVRQYLVHDLAALNKREMLIGDNWGLADCEVVKDPLRTEDAELLDRVAARTMAAGDGAFRDLHRMYERDGRLRVPAEVVCYHLDDAREDGIRIPYA